MTIEKVRLMAIYMICAVLASNALVSASITVVYEITDSTNDWSGTFEVDNWDTKLNEFSFDSPAGNLSVSADGIAILPIQYYGSNGDGWVRWGRHTGYYWYGFSLQSPSLYAESHNNATWSDVLDQGYVITSTN